MHWKTADLQISEFPFLPATYKYRLVGSGQEGENALRNGNQTVAEWQSMGRIGPRKKKEGPFEAEHMFSIAIVCRVLRLVLFRSAQAAAAKKKPPHPPASGRTTGLDTHGNVH